MSSEGFWAVMLLTATGVVCGVVLNWGYSIAEARWQEDKRLRMERVEMTPRHPTAHLDTRSIYCGKGWQEWCDDD